VVVALAKERSVHHSLVTRLLELYLRFRVEFLVLGQLFHPRIGNTLLFLIIVHESLAIFHPELLAGALRQLQQLQQFLVLLRKGFTWTVLIHKI